MHADTAVRYKKLLISQLGVMLVLKKFEQVKGK